MFFTFTALAYSIHVSYPERHDRPEDFPQLLTEGPYSACRHPFYLLLILIQFSIALYFFSLQAAAIAAVFLPMWYALMRIEEKEFASTLRQEVSRIHEACTDGTAAKEESYQA